MFDIPLDLITEDHLQALVDSIAEDRQLEYKQALPGAGYEDTVEFLKDVSAMANSSGGDILYGVREGLNQAGNTVAIGIDGIAGQNGDQVRLRFENLLRNSVKPRLIGVQIRVIAISNGNQIFVVRTPRSWNSPHVVEYQRHWRFYVRDSAGAHPMDVTELRNAILVQDTLGQRLEEFRLERLSRISTDSSLAQGGKIIIHLQPLGWSTPEFLIDLEMLEAQRDDLILMSHDRIAADLRLNFDGVLGSVGNGERGYVQVFRAGVIEEVDAALLRGRRQNRNRIPAFQLERRIITATSRRLRLLRTLGVTKPVMFHLSVLGVKGFTMVFDNLNPQQDVTFLNEAAEERPVDRDDLLLRGSLIETIPTPDQVPEFSERLLHPLLNAIWNAAGFQRSLYYDADGRWTGQLQVGDL